ncbi:aldehyde dehydrogenase family protein [Croceicoccus ponticola]|uniref:Aldehyde dehydrogenase family protein n=1 Tax=Croceicoccus ponticola TaxID=2217664 RepID=A0A437GY02_9SPHN|nr:aldehyde dehydrogenase family protein [Croceicoccus ponticola]RVQ66336.1 aldehyde dehydrogenase family protein [Croceicoccus ponticola]
MIQKPELPAIPGLDEVFVANRFVASTGGEMLDVICPADEEVIASVRMPSVEDADRAVAAARKAFDEGPWPRMTIDERADACSRLADALESRLPTMNLAWMLEAGAPIAHGEMINSGAGKLVWRNAIEKARTLPFEEVRDGPMGRTVIRREPLGVVLSILTYNGPVVLMGMKVIPALLAGCSVIIKPAPESPLTSRLVAEAIEEAGLPEGVVSMLAAGTTVTQHLVSHPGVDMVALTGGTAIAVDVVKRTAPRLARTILELGGKSPAIIADDAPLDTVLPTLVAGASGFLGQVCVSLSRILVSEKRHDEVVEAIGEAYRGLKVGLPWDPSVDRGPIAVKRGRDRAESMVNRAVEQGARVVAGGRRPAHLNRGWFYEPTLLDDVTNDMEIAQEEVFGPVTAVITYRDMDEAIAIANDSKFGLASSIYTQDADLAMDVARKIQSGGVAINAAGVSLTEPFGGFKQSGWGRECGAEGIFEFTDQKQILMSGSYLDA